MCGEGGEHTGKEIENLRESQMSCEPVQFQVTRDPLMENAAVVDWSGDDYAPPYVSFKLNLSGVTTTGNNNHTKS